MREAPPTPYTPPMIAKRLGITPEKVIGWILAGELRAANLAAKPHGRPRWTVMPEALEAFLRGRAPIPPPPKPNRRRRVRSIGKRFF